MKLYVHSLVDKLEGLRQICTESQNTHFVFNNCFSEYRAVCEIMWRNIVEPGRLQMTMWCKHIEC